ncbi:MAG: hypothetical protein QOH31_4498, partial [Verrucomicrobiota bacterium]
GIPNDVSLSQVLLNFVIVGVAPVIPSPALHLPTVACNERFDPSLHPIEFLLSNPGILHLDEPSDRL